MSNNIWAYIDQFKGQALATSWEVLGAARTLAGQMGGGVTALVFGQGVAEVAQEAIHYGADEVLLADEAVLADYRPEPYANLLSKLAGEGRPEVILFPTTTRGRDLAAMVAVDLKTGVLPDVIAMELEDGVVLATRPVYGGKLLSKVRCDAKPQIITLRVRAFNKLAPNASRTGTVKKVEAAVDEKSLHTKVLEYVQSEGGVSLTNATVIVSGGRGVSNRPVLTPPADITDDKDKDIWRAQQGFILLSELAEVLGAAIGASRAAVDAKYITYEHQVGQTGKLVAPDLYIACGISGAIQHLAGMRTSKLLVAINKDPDAPIFHLARYGVVGDIFDILPPLTAALRKRLGKG